MSESKNSSSGEQKNTATRTLQELGLSVQRLREELQITIEAAAAATCVRRNFLEDIEKGDFSRFKALVYARGFVRAYLEFLDAPELWQEYSLLLTAPVLEPKEISAGYRAAPRRLSSSPSASVAAPRGFTRSTVRRNCAILLAVLIVLGLGTVALNWKRISAEIARIQGKQVLDAEAARKAEQQAHEAALKQEEEKVRQEAMKAAAPAAEPAAADQPEPSEKKEEVPPPAEPAPQAPEAPAEVKRELVISAEKGDCWMNVSSGGKSLYSDTMKRGESRTFPLDRPVTVRYGRTQNVTVTLNGKPVENIAREIQDFEYRPDGSVVRLRRNRR